MSGNVTNAVLAAKLDANNSQLGQLQAQLESIGHLYARNDVLELRFKELELKIADIYLNIKKLDTRKTFQNWLLPTLSAILSSVFTYLLIARLQ
jgi:dynactin complex subunit